LWTRTSRAHHIVDAVVLRSAAPTLRIVSFMLVETMTS
jgi:hypothetical protein